jgi:hypothetical protein
MEDYQAKAYNENAAIEMLQGVDGEPMEQVEYLMEVKKQLGTL